MEDSGEALEAVARVEGAMAEVEDPAVAEAVGQAVSKSFAVPQILATLGGQPRLSSPRLTRQAAALRLWQRQALRQRLA